MLNLFLFLFYSKFYIRRQRQRIPNNLPLIQPAEFNENFDDWNTIQNGSSTSTGSQSAQVISQDMLATSQQMDYDDDERMSPLIYDCSSEEEIEQYDLADATENDVNAINTPISPRISSNLTDLTDMSDIPNGQRYRSVTPSSSGASYRTEQLAGDEASEVETPIPPRMTRARQRTSNETPIRRSRRTLQPRTVHTYQQLSIQVTDVSKTERNQTKKYSASKQKAAAIMEKISRVIRSHQSSLSSDVLCISQDLPSPIYITDSSESIFSRKNTNQRTATITSTTNMGHSTKENSRATSSGQNRNHLSPDLFASFSESPTILPNDSQETTKDNVVAVRVNEQVSTDSTTSVNQQFNSTTINELNDSKDLNRTTDIFEITKNDVFHNVLRVTDKTTATVSPISTTNRRSPRSAEKTCFDGVRINLPFVAQTSANPAENSALVKRTVFRKSPIVTKDISIEISDSDSSEKPAQALPSRSARRSLETAFEKVSDAKQGKLSDNETTPPRKEPAKTPSTRSCMRASREERMARDGWLSKRKTPRIIDDADAALATPRSRRQLNMTAAASTSNQSPSAANIQPRTLFEIKTARRFTRSQSIAFSDHAFTVSSSDEELMI